jgi:hypothetical protein
MAGKLEDPVFIDTSIQIARKIHRPEIQNAISIRLLKHDQIVSSLVVRQEFKRRLLKEAIYLLKQLNERKSFQKVMRHVADSLPPAHQRKKQISLDLLMTVDEEDSDADRFDRARLMLRDLIKNGISTAEAHLTKVNTDLGCACGMQPITERKPFERYEMGGDRCSQFIGRCGIRTFLENNREILMRIRDYLAAIPESEDKGGKTPELVRAEQFIQTFLDEPGDVEKLDPCLKVGDLLIALESIGCKTFYTLNAKESQHLARVLSQSLIYRPPNSDHAEVECEAETAEWPKF